MPQVQSLPASAPVCVPHLSNSRDPQKVLTVNAGSRHGEGTVGEETNYSDLLWDVSKLQDKVNLSVTVIATNVAVLIPAPKSRRQLSAVIDTKNSRPFICESSELKDVVAALCCLESFIVHRTKFTSTLLLLREIRVAVESAENFEIFFSLRLAARFDGICR
jgi:hypothetical protein